MTSATRQETMFRIAKEGFPEGWISSISLETPSSLQSQNKSAARSLHHVSDDQMTHPNTTSESTNGR